jgi:hypothetical protein
VKYYIPFEEDVSKKPDLYPNQLTYFNQAITAVDMTEEEYCYIRPKYAKQYGFKLLTDELKERLQKMFTNDEVLALSLLSKVEGSWLCDFLPRLIKLQRYEFENPFMSRLTDWCLSQQITTSNGVWTNQGGRYVERMIFAFVPDKKDRDAMVRDKIEALTKEWEAFIKEYPLFNEYEEDILDAHLKGKVIVSQQ